MVCGAREVMAMALSEKQPCLWVALLRDMVRGAHALGTSGRAGARTGGCSAVNAELILRCSSWES